MINLSDSAELILHLINRLQLKQKRTDLKKGTKRKIKMNEKLLLFGVLLVLSEGNAWNHYSQLTDSASWRSSDQPKLNNTVQYCYHFTWMGGKFNQWTFKNIRNKTCAQYFKDKKTLCINPMVATYKGGKPDLKYILANHAQEATCRLSQEHVCVKYTVFYNGIISYETRYCSTVNIDMEGPMHNGCIQEKRGSQVIEVCACKSQFGADGICNVGSHIAIKPFLFIVLVICSLFINFYIK